jgi:hypothetical protein
MLALSSCAKEYSCENGSQAVTPILVFPSCKPVPFLTDKFWTADTVVITPPTLYSQLSASDQIYYNAAIIWFRRGNVTFNSNCKMGQGLTDWDSGFDKWTVSDNNKDLHILTTNGYIDTLYNFTADSLHFSYQRKLPSFTLTYIFK